ncbi:oxygenase MpaB family protein [Flavitalea flava]
MDNFFVNDKSIVRKIWGRSDTVLLIFAGAAAEFALNKSVDWLYYTGRLPADPIGRLFSTVRYAQEIVFSENDHALASIDKITAIHREVEHSRGARIPATAYLDVLFMLIDYSIRSFELLERRLEEAEKKAVFEVFYRVGLRMELEGLPADYDGWKLMRRQNLETNLQYSSFTRDLFRQYNKQLGSFRYHILLQAQALLAPPGVGSLMALPSLPWFYVVLPFYKAARWLKFDGVLKAFLLPANFKMQIAGLDK